MRPRWRAQGAATVATRRRVPCATAHRRSTTTATQTAALYRNSSTKAAELRGACERTARFGTALTWYCVRMHGLLRALPCRQRRRRRVPKCVQVTHKGVIPTNSKAAMSDKFHILMFWPGTPPKLVARRRAPRRSERSTSRAAALTAPQQEGPRAPQPSNDSQLSLAGSASRQRADAPERKAAPSAGTGRLRSGSCQTHVRRAEA